MNNNTSQKSLDDIILELLKSYGFDLDFPGTKYYKEVIKNIILILQTSPDDKKISNLIKDLNNSYSQFYLDIAQDYLQSGGLKTLERHISYAVEKAQESSKLPSNFKDYKTTAFDLATQIYDVIVCGEVTILESKTAHTLVRIKKTNS